MKDTDKRQRLKALRKASIITKVIEIPFLRSNMPSIKLTQIPFACNKKGTMKIKLIPSAKRKGFNIITRQVYPSEEKSSF